jgi:hypothetical protein
MFLDAHGKLATPPGAQKNHPDLRHCAIRDSVVLFNDERARRQRPCSDDLLPLVLARASLLGT